MCRASTTAVQMSANVFVKCYLTLPAYRYVIIESSSVDPLCLGEVMVYVSQYKTQLLTMDLRAANNIIALINGIVVTRIAKIYKRSVDILL
jgi:hypothetical protein